MSERAGRKIIGLRSGEDNVTVTARVLEVREPRVVETRKGPRTLSEAIIGDETGRVKLTLWGKHAGTLKEGQAIRIVGGWTTSFRGEVQLNVGSKGSIEVLDDSSAPAAEEVPESTPKAERQAFRRPYTPGGPRRRPGGRRGWS